MHLNKCIDKINQLITPSTSNTLFCYAFTKMQYKKCINKMNAFMKWNKCIKNKWNKNKKDALIIKINALIK